MTYPEALYERACVLQWPCLRLLLYHGGEGVLTVLLQNDAQGDAQGGVQEDAQNDAH
jgi:hypothetical protein